MTHPQSTLPGHFTIDCANCGVPFTVYRSAFLGGRRCCSHKCAGAVSPHSDIATRFWEKVDKTGDCWLWTANTITRGYGRFYFPSKRRKAQIILATHAAWELATGDLVPRGFEACHTCDNAGCVRNDEPGVHVVNGTEYPRIGHLFLAPHFVNMADMLSKGRHPHGEESHRVTLTGLQVDTIRAEYAAGGVLQRELAERFGVTSKTISKVITRRLWAHR